MFKLNLEKAKEIHRNNIRRAREEKFKELDFQYMRSLEQKNTKKVQEIVSLKQILRDLPQCDEICNATCLNDLKNHWPDILGTESPYT